MTLPESLTHIRAFCQHTLELHEKATPAPWDKIVKMEGFTAVGANTLIARVFSTAFRDHANEKANAELIAFYRNFTPGMAQGWLNICDLVEAHEFGGTPIFGMKEVVDAFAETLPEVPQ